MADPTCTDQRAHWDDTLAGHADMFGVEPSDAARAARRRFADAGAQRVLELGAGQGRDTFWFAAKGLDVVALDFAESGVEAIHRRAARTPVAGQVAAQVHDVRQPLPFDDASFDACYSHMLFCMALSTDELVALAADVRRVVRPGGLVVYTVRHVGDAHAGTGRVLGDAMYENGGFVVHFFDRPLVERLAFGFELLEVTEFEEGALPRRLWAVTMRGEKRATSAGLGCRR